MSDPLQLLAQMRAESHAGSTPICGEDLYELTDSGGFCCNLPPGDHTEHAETGRVPAGLGVHHTGYIDYRITWVMHPNTVVDAE